ncbi:MAG: hypothetical protein AAF958_00875 [Planctomycetota bacterium]
MTAKLIPPKVKAAFDQFSSPNRAVLLDVQEMIFDVAKDNERVGPLTETLKWCEPAYLTEQTKRLDQ